MYHKSNNLIRGGYSPDVGHSGWGNLSGGHCLFLTCQGGWRCWVWGCGGLLNVRCGASGMALSGRHDSTCFSGRVLERGLFG